MYRVDRRNLPRTEIVAVSGCVYKGPALITGLSITGTAATPDGQILDGVNSNGTEKIDLRVIQDESFSPSIGGGIFCEKGIYAAVDASTTKLSITFYPVVYEEDEA